MQQRWEKKTPPQSLLWRDIILAIGLFRKSGVPLLLDFYRWDYV
ncbi:MAG: hypothetical protein OFPI_05140 [Osedax symbiont Rs2]|nr:MAG: hypothetical protein OFPI_05140 [Osedax symbiont Rs2]